MLKLVALIANTLLALYFLLLFILEGGFESSEAGAVLAVFLFATLNVSALTLGGDANWISALLKRKRLEEEARISELERKLGPNRLNESGGSITE